jgi:hypothetical protein
MDTHVVNNPAEHRRGYSYMLQTPQQRLMERRERILRSRELLGSADPLGSILAHLKKFGYCLIGDKLTYQRVRSDSLFDWVYVNYARNTKCALWHNAIYDSFGFIPTPCHECFKVVVKPRTVKELFGLYELSKSFPVQSKCGVDRREFSFGSYSQFFYVANLEEGRRCYREVREAVSDTLSPDVPVVLKCGCTRYELEMGPSDQWQITPEQVAFETFLKENVTPDIMTQEMEPYAQPEEMVAAIQKAWLYWAYHIGDNTYLEFNDGQPLFPKGATYHDKD